MGLFYFCSDCAKKYRTLHRLKEHVLETHKKELKDAPERKECSSNKKRNRVGLFYFCPDCRRKYKTLPRLKEHVLQVHEKELKDAPERKEYSSNKNKKRTRDDRDDRPRDKRQRKQKKEDEEEEEKTCIICFDEPPGAVFHPCGHATLCFACALVMKDTRGRCPLCNRSIVAVIKPFF